MLTSYLPVCADSNGYANFLEWVNLHYEDKLPSSGSSKNIIIFVPFSTDTINAYQWVCYYSQVPAIENELIVVITVSIGNLRYAENMDIQPAQAAIYCPIDFPELAIP